MSSVTYRTVSRWAVVILGASAVGTLLWWERPEAKYPVARDIAACRARLIGCALATATYTLTGDTNGASPNKPWDYVTGTAISTNPIGIYPTDWLPNVGLLQLRNVARRDLRPYFTSWIMPPTNGTSYAGETGTVALAAVSWWTNVYGERLAGGVFRWWGDTNWTWAHYPNTNVLQAFGKLASYMEWSYAGANTTLGTPHKYAPTWATDVPAPKPHTNYVGSYTLPIWMGPFDPILRWDLSIEGGWLYYATRPVGSQVWADATASYAVGDWTHTSVGSTFALTGNGANPVGLLFFAEVEIATNSAGPLPWRGRAHLDATLRPAYFCYAIPGDGIEAVYDIWGAKMTPIGIRFTAEWLGRASAIGGYQFDACGFDVSTNTLTAGTTIVHDGTNAVPAFPLVPAYTNPAPFTIPAYAPTVTNGGAVYTEYLWNGGWRLAESFLAVHWQHTDLTNRAFFWGTP
jgi:hypothetical protein